MQWNGIIRSVQVSYLKNCVGFQLVFIALIKDQVETADEVKTIAIVTCVF